MRKIFFALFAMFTFSIAIYAEGAGVSGKVIEIKSGENVPYATVSVKDNAGTIIKGAITDDSGNFSIDGLKQGEYILEVAFLGYASTSSTFAVTQKNEKVNVGEITLEAESIEVEGVQVTAQQKTSSSKIDRRSYNPEDFETAKGGTATDVLGKLPSVSVGPDGEVSVRGTSDFVVYLNGKPTNMEPSVLLASIASENIENIEVITIPSARYDAQGKGGIINITTKRIGASGLSVSANGTLGGTPWANKTDKYSGYDMNDNRYGGGINFIYNKENLSLYGAVSYSMKNVNGKRVGDARIDTSQNNGGSSVYKHMAADGERPEWYENYSANVGMDYSFNKNSLLSASYYYGYRKEGRSAFYVYEVFYADKDKNEIEGVDINRQWVYNPNTDNRYGKFHTANIDYNQKFDNNSSLKLSALYEHSSLSRQLYNSNYDFSKETDEVEAMTEHYSQADDTPLDGYRFSIDYEKEFDNGHALGLGAQPQYLTQAGGFTYDTFNVENGNWGGVEYYENEIDLKRGIYAGYIDYSGEVEDFSFMLGTRLEYTDQVLELANADYFNLFGYESQSKFETKQLDWFPTLHTQYKAGELNKFKLAASRRINRPPTKNMAPFLYRRHLEVYVVGDPNLKPEYLSNVELSYDRKLGKHDVSLAGFYRGVDNEIFRVNTVDYEEDVLIRSYTNSGNSNSIGAELNANFVTDKAKFFLGGSLYQYNIKADVFGFKENNKSANWSLKGNMNWNLTDVLKWTIDFDMKSATVTAQGRNELFYMANTAFNYAPEQWNDWNFSLRVPDILSSNNKALNTRAYSENQVEIFYQEVEYIRQGPILELGASYSFNMKDKKSKKAGSTFGTEQF